MNIMKLGTLVILSAGILACTFFLFQTTSSPHKRINENYFLVANYFNSQEALEYTIPEIKKLLKELRNGENLYVSFFENGSEDDTASLLKEFQKSLDIPNTIIVCNMTGSNAWEGKQILGEELSKKVFKMKAEYRYRKMAGIRNVALLPLYDHTFEHNEWPTKIVFLNDIYFTADEILELIYTKEGNFDVVCPLDFYYEFYDTLVARDVEGYWFSGNYPFTRHNESQVLIKNNEPFEVYSCWNGIAILNAEPILKQGVKFRPRKYDSENCECPQSECLLICTDYRKKGYDKIYINPKVRVSYEWKYYMLHKYPVFRALVNLYQWMWYEFNEVSYGKNASEVGCGMPPYFDLKKEPKYMSLVSSECKLPYRESHAFNATPEKIMQEQKYTERFYNRLLSTCIDDK
ncbi:unnamed protein product [Blepharisma stoltei]|uniref:Glycosyltransferase family 69 protein n=1 Tax=Blepharisma stoltei TaxID=1481888 RepID=A0AAU9KCY8_9CILI|nr:unnamed protein product [Blepharisma stoltei]